MSGLCGKATFRNVSERYVGTNGCIHLNAYFNVLEWSAFHAFEKQSIRGFLIAWGIGETRIMDNDKHRLITTELQHFYA